ncbi:MAG: hypothetical protein EOQ98_13035 [Mesorhizobium sp.]|uniref:RES domain-containing protein n=1 Tax=Mesorhizobium mediterraneum TaxID=43617 RepID=A0AB36R7B8_9HYPH|nr:hypothetical protein CIT25_20085 [Mesorhizobium mediterraneum]RWN40020.1 MAG: hypothetical protein EOR96_18185 [Mesorhizobium sp.]RWO99684.1 MAG: hypothetical protein EOQ98_13035 [Mesorhizobium sp.]RWP83451.1 MAG: hypothetical protein EOR10_00820 [Mesorhizobium sp.]RWQ44293.1 MAG: hypothetical protein EOS21_01695 [Mesorhizobium sp.]
MCNPSGRSGADLGTELSPIWKRARHLQLIAWATALSGGERPASWSIYDRLRPQGIAGILIPSLLRAPRRRGRNLVLWDWGPDLSHKVNVFDPSGRLPKD